MSRCPPTFYERFITAVYHPFNFLQAQHAPGSEKKPEPSKPDLSQLDDIADIAKTGTLVSTNKAFYKSLPMVSETWLHYFLIFIIFSLDLFFWFLVKYCFMFQQTQAAISYRNVRDKTF